ncbi:MAG: DMT family transporter [Chloroflexi bacterium]|nr:DMT family transporter [Chloroflexota bacterium]
MDYKASSALSIQNWQYSDLGKRLLTKRSLGILIVLFSAASFGAVTPFARIAYDRGVNVITVIMARYAVAGVAVILYLAWHRQPWRLFGNLLWKTLGLALVLGVASYAYLGSIKYIPVSLSALIYYTNPILVSLFAFLIGKRRIIKKDQAAYYLTFGGQLLSLFGLLLLLRLSWNALNLTGVLMAAFSAVSFALVFTFGSRLLRSIPPMVLNLYIAIVNTIFFAIVGMLSSGFTPPEDNPGWIGIIGVAVFFTIGFLGLFVGVRMIGPSRAACLTNVEPVVTITLAILLLSEPFSSWQFVGGGAVIFGIFIMCYNIIFT